MNCSKVQGKISAFIDSELDVQFHKEVASHLEVCRECRKMQSLMEQADELVKKSEEIMPSASFEEILFVRLEQDLARPQQRSLVRRIVESGLDFFDRFFDVLQQRKYYYTRSLEEFNDFPPYSLGYVYCTQLKLCKRGL